MVTRSPCANYIIIIDNYPTVVGVNFLKHCMIENRLMSHLEPCHDINTETLDIPQGLDSAIVDPLIELVPDVPDGGCYNGNDHSGNYCYGTNAKYNVMYCTCTTLFAR